MPNPVSSPAPSPTYYKYCLFMQYIDISNGYNPQRTVTDRERIIGIIEQGRLDSVIITADLSADGRPALEKYLRYYLQDKYANGPLVACSDKAESLMRRISALKQDPVLTTEAHQTDMVRPCGVVADEPVRSLHASCNTISSHWYPPAIGI